MHVFINAEAATRRSGGIGKYTGQLLIALKNFETVENLYAFNGISWQEYLGVVNAAAPQEPSPKQASLLRKVARNIPGLKSLHQKVVGMLFKRRVEKWFNQGVGSGSLKLYHEPNYILKPFDGLKVATIHDLSFIYYPEFHPAARVDYFKKNLPKTLKTADHLITDTECIRQELIKEFKLPPERVTAVHLGVDDCYKPRGVTEVNSVLENYALEYEGYFLSVATLEPRKNLGNILQAFSKLPPELRKQYPLVLVGCEGWQNNDLLKEIEKLEKDNEVKMLGYVDEQDLPSIYAGARSVVFIPVYEGFGLPSIEAMASGVPLLASDIPCLREVVEEGGMYTSCDNVAEITSAMLTVLTDQGVRGSLSEKGLLQAKKFSWSKCAKETLSVYEKVASQ